MITDELQERFLKSSHDFMQSQYIINQRVQNILESVHRFEKQQYIINCVIAGLLLLILAIEITTVLK